MWRTSGSLSGPRRAIYSDIVFSRISISKRAYASAAAFQLAHHVLLPPHLSPRSEFIATMIPSQLPTAGRAHDTTFTVHSTIVSPQGSLFCVCRYLGKDHQPRTQSSHSLFRDFITDGFFVPWTNKTERVGGASAAVLPFTRSRIGNL